MAIIGIDLDNTVICYDRLFSDYIAKFNLVAQENVPVKDVLKASLIANDKSEYSWQKVQGEVYGKKMHDASIFPGFIKFIITASLNGDRLIFISHKTKFAHHDPLNTNLRDAAKRWLEDNVFSKINGCNCFLEERVIFADTREEKLEAIERVGCNIFIDDLPELLLNEKFPSATDKILFSPSGAKAPLAKYSVKQFSSWHLICESFYGPASGALINKILNYKYPELSINKVDIIRAGINSTVAKIQNVSGRCYALKMYPDFIGDKRDRLGVEWSALEILSRNKFLVPRPVLSDADLNWGVYEWINGVNIIPQNDEFLVNSINFIKNIQSNQRVRSSFKPEFLASEACLSCNDLLNQLATRFSQLKAMVFDEEVKFFLNNDFEELYQHFIVDKRELIMQFSDILPLELRVLSPSDFGSHNMILDYFQNIFYYDFEYFGWDDPVKMVADFYWHPGMNLGENLKDKWLILAKDTFKKDPKFSLRLDTMLPLYGLKWCLIMLNTFKHGSREKSSNPNLDASHSLDKKFEQFNKSKTLFNKIREIYG